VPGVVIHVGFPKTASTFLQDNIFSRSPELVWVGHDITPSLYERSISDQQRKEAMVRLSDLRKIADRERKTLIISDEILAVGAWLPRDVDRIDQPENIRVRLQGLAPNAKILIVIRPQYDWLTSWWRQYTTAMGTETLEQVIDSHFFETRLRPMLCYDRTVEAYQAAFGAEAVKVLLFSDLRFRSDVFFTSLKDTLQVSHISAGIQGRNEGRSMAMSRLRQRANLALEALITGARFSPERRDAVERNFHSFWKRYVNPIDRLLPSTKRTASAGLKKRVDAMFADDNRRLFKRIGIQEHHFDPSKAVAT
jgi:hypothetical protein